MNKNIRKTVYAAMMAALVFLATAVIAIPNGLNGYFNLGDGLVLLSGYLLGPLWGFLAAGIGSCLADLLGGYMVYVPATFLIKGTMALIAALGTKRGGQTKSTVFCLLTALAAELVMVFGYFGFSALLLGNGLAAAVSIPSDLMQGSVGVLLFFILRTLFGRFLSKGFDGQK